MRRRRHVRSARAFLAIEMLAACAPRPRADASARPAPAAPAASPSAGAAPAPKPARHAHMVCRSSRDGRSVPCGTPDAMMVGIVED